jgi:succinylarginine dihydrolase
MSDAERAAVAANVWLDDELHAALTAWVSRHYRDRLTPGDLADPALLDEGRQALDELSGLLRIGRVYPFQMA